MFVTLSDMKTRLGVSGTDDDAWLTQQITLIGNVIDNYLNRKLESATYTETFYRDDYQAEEFFKNPLVLYHYPVTSVAVNGLKEIETTDGVDAEDSLEASEYRAYNGAGFIYKMNEGCKLTWFSNLGVNSRIEIEYTAGYTTIPAEIQEVVYALVGERYAKYKAGMDLSFGPDVQRVAIPGMMSIDFDYTLQQNLRSTKFGMILGNWVNVLDDYRNERTVIGTVREHYVS